MKIKNKNINIKIKGVPQMLQYNGILKYSASLNKDLEDHVVLIAGSEREVEIRAARSLFLILLYYYLLFLFSFYLLGYNY